MRMCVQPCATDRWILGRGLLGRMMTRKAFQAFSNQISWWGVGYPAQYFVCELPALDES